MSLSLFTVPLETINLSIGRKTISATKDHVDVPKIMAHVEDQKRKHLTELMTYLRNHMYLAKYTLGNDI